MDRCGDPLPEKDPDLREAIRLAAIWDKDPGNLIGILMRGWLWMKMEDGFMDLSRPFIEDEAYRSN